MQMQYKQKSTQILFKPAYKTRAQKTKENNDFTELLPISWYQPFAKISLPAWGTAGHVL